MIFSETFADRVAAKKRELLGGAPGMLAVQSLKN